ncbi:hypothetical protein A2Z33_05310 [Candidatus Gottesmanbacteria bacterium RBG_16_52_11]|uniref:VTT domain-containing protein n=1 Tax=Candidatus Gottesmanbacteria bacterium RBG_16_52_11 TaxID=1798374 RepID=A0A1F5YQN6_9BACT|nr:MAG: hypothetical protein A2Z33_05310 [Candidatus Gottesmanbacteria bacterium RBG_16_52_11]
MDFLLSALSFFLHIDKHLSEIITSYGTFTYLILFVVIFLETGLVVTPFLPGDSLLFAAGAFAALGSLHIAVLFAVLSGAAILGDTANYWIGHMIGPKAFSGRLRFLKREHLDKTHAYFEKYGGKTVIIARFVPIVRTFAPFVAGVGAMTYGRFLAYNIAGGLFWVTLFLFAGFYFGNLSFVKHNFTLVILVIIFISVLPAISEFVRHRRIRKREVLQHTSAKDINLE